MTRESSSGSHLASVTDASLQEFTSNQTLKRRHLKQTPSPSTIYDRVIHLTLLPAPSLRATTLTATPPDSNPTTETITTAVAAAVSAATQRSHRRNACVPCMEQYKK